MATAERDYYELLGVERTATDAEIKKAFRKLARELHPDVNAEPDAQERFRAVAEAYEVLSDAERRRLYDQFGHAGLRRGGYAPSDFAFTNLSDIFSAFFGDDLFARNRGGRARGGDVGVSVTIELADAFTGVTRSVAVDIASTCERCDGDGAEPGTDRVTCGTCGGQGQLQQVSRSVFGEFVRTQACPACRGAGTIVETPCTTCGIPGDAYVEVRVRGDKRLERDGDDVLSEVDLTIVQAARGAQVSVPTLEGELALEFEPGTQ